MTYSYTAGSLQHHGILGQKWGIRRFQPYSTVPRGSGKSGKEVGDAAKAEKKRQKNIDRGEKRLNKRMDYLAKKTKGMETSLNANQRFNAIKYDQALKATKEILANEQRTERVGKITKRQTAVNIGSSAAVGALIAAIVAPELGMATIVPTGMIAAGSAYIQHLINQ